MAKKLSLLDCHIVGVYMGPGCEVQIIIVVVVVAVVLLLLLLLIFVVIKSVYGVAMMW